MDPARLSHLASNPPAVAARDSRRARLRRMLLAALGTLAFGLALLYGAARAGQLGALEPDDDGEGGPGDRRPRVREE